MHTFVSCIVNPQEAELPGKIYMRFIIEILPLYKHKSKLVYMKPLLLCFFFFIKEKGLLNLGFPGKTSHFK